MAIDETGKVLGLRIRTHANVGAYPGMTGIAIQVLIGPWVQTSVYDIQNIDFHYTAVLTNTAPTGAYRGAGRPEAIFNIERLMDEAARQSGIDRVAEELGSVDILVSNAGIQIVYPFVSYSFADWKKMQAIHVDGAFLTTRAALRHMYKDDRGGVVIYMGSVHSHEGSPLKSAYVAAKHALLGLNKVLAKEGAAHNVRSHVVCPGFVRTPLVEKQIPEQAKELGISEEEVVKKVMLGDTVDGVFTTVEDVAETVRFLATFPSAALVVPSGFARYANRDDGQQWFSTRDLTDENRMSRIGAILQRLRVPTCGADRAFTEAGGLAVGNVKKPSEFR